MKQNWLRVSIFALAATTAVLNVMFAGCAKSPEEQRLERIRRGDETLNIILISIDTLRADALGCYGGDIAKTPNIDRLAAEGTLFAECKSPVPLTLPSHTTMLTGAFPPYHGVHNNLTSVPDKGLDFLSETLNKRGYRTGAIIGSFQLDDVFDFDQGFDYYDDEFTVGTGGTLAGFEKPANQIMARAEAWLADAAGEPFFLFVHFFDPHLPYAPPKKYFDEYSNNAYFGEVAFVDYSLGKLVPALEVNGLSENTLVIITSDHGESLGEHGEQTHAFFVYEATQHVPLIMYCPGLIPAGQKVEGPVRLADVCPTVLDILGIEPPASVQGESLIPYIYGKPKADRVVYEESYYGGEMFGWARLYALEKNGWKYIEAPRPELYDLTDDADELINSVNDEPAIAARMSEELEELRTGLAENGVGEAALVTLSNKGKTRIETLGYITSVVTADGPKNGADPKDKVDFIRLYAEYYKSLSPPDLKRYVEVLNEMIQIEPDTAFPYVKLGVAYKDSGDYDKAVALFEKALELQPGYKEAGIHLANTYASIGAYDDARGLLDELEKDPKATPVDLASAYYTRGNLTLRSGGPEEEAIRYFEKSANLQKDFAEPYFALANIFADTVGGEKKAKEYAERFLELEPRGEDAARMRALLGQESVEELATKGEQAYLGRDFDEAAEFFRRAYEQDPSYYEMRYNLACCLALGERPGEAVNELKALVRDQPGVFDEAITRDRDLDSLRDREDFKRLLE